MEPKIKIARCKSAVTIAEIQGLRDTINVSQCHLLKSQEDLKHVKNQLKCLIHLVKRAWSGDVEASVHVANIVGVAPPDLKLRGDTNEVVAVPKPAVLNNWACLTIGLLNRQQAYDEKETKLRQLAYLLEREKYLDKQLHGFVQKPEMRETKDSASCMISEMLQDLKSQQSVKERSVAKWQTDIKEQRSRLMNRQICFESSDQAESSQTEDKDSKGEVENGDFGLSIDVSQPPILQRKINSHKKQHKSRAQERANKQEKAPELPISSAARRPPRRKTSKPIEGRDFRVQVTKKSSRPFSAVDAVAATNENCSSLRKSSRRKSLESSLTRERYKSEQIEKEVKKTASELQMKLNISTSAQLKF